MYKPVSGERATYADYFRKGDTRLHLIGILGGIIWSLGMTFNIIASGQAGFAISYGLGQGATLIAALWGVFIWKEFGKAEGLKGSLTTMFLFYLAGSGADYCFPLNIIYLPISQIHEEDTCRWKFQYGSDH